MKKEFNASYILVLHSGAHITSSFKVANFAEFKAAVRGDFDLHQIDAARHINTFFYAFGTAYRSYSPADVVEVFIEELTGLQRIARESGRCINSIV